MLKAMKLHVLNRINAKPTQFSNENERELKSLFIVLRARLKVLHSGFEEVEIVGLRKTFSGSLS